MYAFLLAQPTGTLKWVPESSKQTEKEKSAQGTAATNFPRKKKKYWQHVSLCVYVNMQVSRLAYMQFLIFTSCMFPTSPSHLSSGNHTIVSSFGTCQWRGIPGSSYSDSPGSNPHSNLMASRSWGDITSFSSTPVLFSVEPFWATSAPQPLYKITLFISRDTRTDPVASCIH